MPPKCSHPTPYQLSTLPVIMPNHLRCSVIQDEHEGAAKKGLAVLTEMWRRHVWRDARTVNVIAAACQHKSSRVMLGALKFFLGQDAAESDKGENGAYAGWG